MSPAPFLRLLALAAAILPSGVGAADGERRDIRIGIGADVIHERYTLAGRIKYGPLVAIGWHDNFGVGATWDFGRRDGFNGGVGAVLVRETNGSVGTHLNFLLRGSYCRRHACLSLVHISHGSDLGILPHRENDGLNFVFLEWRH